MANANETTGALQSEQGSNAPTITLNLDQLRQAVAEWEALHRAGGTQDARAVAAKSVEEVAKESADYLWGVLQAIVSS